MPFKDNIWKPNNQKQALFLSLPLTIKEGFFGGGAGSGKSEILLMYGIVNGWHDKAGFKQVFMRRTYPEIKREIIPRSRDMYLRLGAKFSKQDMAWTFPREDQYGSGFEPNGGMIFFGHCENEDDVHNYDGMEINLFTPDELTSFTEYIYIYIAFTRVRARADSNLPAIIRASGMPGDVGHGFVKKRFVDPSPLGNKVIVGKGNNKRLYVHSTYKDNIDGDPNYGQALEALPEAERRAKKFGDWSSFEGSVFDELRDKLYPDEPPNALHLIPYFEIPEHWPRICAIDWGYSAMCSVGWAAISPTHRVYIYRHQIFYRQKIETWVPEVKYFVDTDKPEDIIICHSANQHRGDPQNILEQVVMALGVSVRLGPRDRVGGKLLIHEYLRWTKKESLPPSEVAVYDDKLAQWILRNKGLGDYKIYLASFQPEPDESNIPKLQFLDTPEVRVIVDTLKACVYEKPDKSGKKKEDVAEFNGDDPYDMLRMLLTAADNYFNESTDRQEQISRVESVMSQYKATQDMTSFYRNMRKIESEDLENIKPIRRYHRGRAN